MPAETAVQDTRLGKHGLRMKDVAARAGVSVMTVSRALSTPEKVSGDTLRRVQAAVDAVLYVPNGLAGNLSSRRSKAVGVIVPGINNSLYSGMIEAVSATLRAQGYHLMIADSGLSLENEEKAITSFLAQRVCGLILHNTQHTRKARNLISNIGVPTIEVGNLVERPIDLCVSYSNFDAAKAMTVHLGRLGYRRIAFVSLALANNDRARKRRDGFLAGLRELGISADSCLSMEAESGLHGGADAIKRIAKTAPSIEAVFFSADVMAVGALLECQRRGWGVPSKFAISSFDDVDLLRHVSPMITTLQIPRAEIGRKSAELLLARVQNRSTLPKVVDLGFDIIQREST
ncbi:MAG TPA: LacI family DNA-binding transcriptional regulator [Bradyrhizobium sp.]|uniref:LacI family DNA-binding transcriptional regulator n=1 Tax=Bradyrhizobium sp. TaxID=376 RepID=UPI002D7F1C32|nr:LacI family DNA-binding transcriptional regulator [Bradyrhizobium sp.]HET7885949.1 LacI family DNA-binding transcriptional regulator [Bradyrhizobium sp.]